MSFIDAQTGRFHLVMSLMTVSPLNYFKGANTFGEIARIFIMYVFNRLINRQADFI